MVSSGTAYNRFVKITVRQSIAVTALVTALSIAGFAQDKEVKVKMQDLPLAVQKTVREQAKGATLHGLSKEIEDGKTFYEAEYR